jgi:hypothetical protein
MQQGPGLPHTDLNVDQRKTSVTGLLGWERLKHRRLMAQLSLFFKIHTKQVDIEFPSSISPSLGISTRARHQNKLQHIQCFILIYRYALFPRLIPIWNALPSHVVGCTDTKQFQKLAAPVVLSLQPTPGLRRL